MPQVKSKGQVKAASGNHSRKEVKETGRQGLARDDLHSAYGGDQNRGPAGKISSTGPVNWRDDLRVVRL